MELERNSTVQGKLFFFFSNGHTCSIWTFLGQGLNLNFWSDLSHCRWIFFFFFFFLIFLGLYLWYMEVPRLGVKSRCSCLAYTTATATWDPGHICDLHIPQLTVTPDPSPAREARDWSCVLMELVRFVSAEPWRELPINWFLIKRRKQEKGGEKAKKQNDGDEIM